MKSRWTIFVLLTVLFYGCNLPSRVTITPPPSVPVTGPLTAASPTRTPIPIETLLALPTPTFVLIASQTPRILLAIPISQPVNCRFGPSTAYAVVGVLEVGQRAEIVGKNIDMTWWYVKNPSDPSTHCWLIASLIEASGNLEALPVLNAPPAEVTEIQIRIDPPSLNVACTAFPQYVTVNADITANGPATVTWRWETSEGEVFNANPLLYLEAGTQGGFIYYRVNSAQDYWLQVHILGPNDTTERVNFKATCLP